MAVRGRGLRRLGAGVLALTLVTMGLQVLVAGSASALEPTDVSVDLVAAGPFTYNHDTLAGSGNLPRYGSRTISNTNGVVESLEGGDFACGDLVLFFGRVAIDAGATGGAGTVRLDMSFLTEPTGQPGVGFDDIVNSTVGISPKDDLAGGANVRDGDESVTLVGEGNGQTGGHATRLGTIVITGLEAGETVVYQVAGHLGCAPNTSPTGNLQVAIVSGTVDGDRLGVGNQTIPFKKVEDIAQPGIDVTKSCPASATVGQTITYQITVSNTGNEGLANITVQDTILGNLSGSFADTLAAGASETRSFQYTIRPSDPDPLVNRVTVNAVGAQSGAAVSDTAECTTTTPRVDVAIDKDADAPSGGVEPGQSFNYTITVTASGTASAQGVTVTDTIPTGLTIASATFSGGSAGSGNCSISGQTVTCSLGDLAPGSTATVRIAVTATAGACPAVTNRATVTATNEDAGAGGNNTSPDVVVVVNCPLPQPEPGVAVSIVKENDANGDGIFTNNEEAKREGLDVPFFLVITNVGEETFRITSLSDRFEHTVVDLLLAKCASVDGVTLAPGESVACTFTMNNYSPPADSPIENVARVCVRETGGDDTDCDQDPSIVSSAVVLGRTVTPPPTTTPPGGIAFTGPTDSTVAFVALALALLMLGTGLLWAGYRRRAQPEG